MGSQYGSRPRGRRTRITTRRKTAPEVVDGVVQRKNRWAQTPSFYHTPQDVPVIHRERPGPDHRHLLRKRHIIDFISILPEWAELSRGLNAVLLAHADDSEGWYRHQPGIVAVCAWPKSLWLELDPDYFAAHEAVLVGRLGVAAQKMPADEVWEEHVLCKFTEPQARAYQLLHILLHELGHHHDRMNTRSKRETSRGEPYAEEYARKYEAVIWERYCQVFGTP
jgi:hypothetical protein